MKKNEVAKKMNYPSHIRRIAQEGMVSKPGDKKHIDKFLSLKREERGKVNILQGRMYRGLHKSQKRTDFEGQKSYKQEDA